MTDSAGVSGALALAAVGIGYQRRSGRRLHNDLNSPEGSFGTGGRKPSLDPLCGCRAGIVCHHAVEDVPCFLEQVVRFEFSDVPLRPRQ